MQIERNDCDSQAYLDHLEAGQMVATLLESLDDLADQVALNAVWLNHDVCSL